MNKPDSWWEVAHLRALAEKARDAGDDKLGTYLDGQATAMGGRLRGSPAVVAGPERAAANQERRRGLGIAFFLLFAGAFGLVYAILRLRGGR